MQKVRLSLLAILLFLSGNSIFAQISEGGQPYSFSHPELIGAVPVLIMPEVNTDSLKADDANNHKSGPWRFGWNHLVNFGINSAGLWQTLPDGSRLWRCAVECPGAYSINLTLDHYRLPVGAKLFVYNEDKSSTIGGFTSSVNQEDGQLGMNIVKGNHITLEYSVPAGTTDLGELNVGMVTHGYRDLFGWAKAFGFGASGSCMYNVNCPQGDGWRDQINSVAIIVVGGSAACSGAMVNDVIGTGKPYFLTANHCGTTGVGTWVFYFNFQSSSCTPSVDGPTTQSVSGSVLCANNAASDFNLVRMNARPPASYNAFYAGWSSLDSTPLNGTCIHHPSGDVKKITKDKDPIGSSTWSGTPTDFHWYPNWDTGVTEPGSSGSPLFDQNKRIVGQLHGGPSACGASDVHDLYGKFSKSWNYGGSTATRLKEWLDPCNINPGHIDGVYYPTAPDSLDAGVLSVSFPSETFCNDSNISVQVVIKDYGYDTIRNATIKYRLDAGPLQSYSWSGLISPCNRTAIVSLPAIITTSGTHTFTVYTYRPNTNSDQNNSNDTLRSSFNIRVGTPTILRFRTDHHGAQSSYVVYNPITNDTVLNVAPGSLANDSLYNYSLCLAATCYDLDVFDSGGDGICCSSGSGYFVVYNPTDTFARGGTFTSFTTSSICLISSSTINFNTSATSSCVGSPITFTSVENNISHRTWTITGAGLSRTDTNRIVTLTPTSAGLISINLIGTGPYGADTAAATNYISVGAASSSSSSLSLCVGRNIRVGAHTYSSAGTFLDTLGNSVGCDSFITTHITMLARATSNTNATICSGQTYHFGSRNYSGSGSYYDTLVAFNGCDSTAHLILNVLPRRSAVYSANLCSGESVTVNGTVFNSTGTRYDTLAGSNGCDSILQISITVHARPQAMFTSHPATTATSNDGSISVFGFSGAAPFTNHWNTGVSTDTLLNLHTGNYYDTLRDANGCDSVYMITVGKGSGIDNPHDAEVRVFPVPSTGMVRVEALSFHNIEKIDLMNMLGEHLAPVIIRQDANVLQLDLSALPAAVYMLRIEEKSHSYTTRLIKE